MAKKKKKKKKDCPIHDLELAGGNRICIDIEGALHIQGSTIMLQCTPHNSNLDIPTKTLNYARNLNEEDFELGKINALSVLKNLGFQKNFEISENLH